MMAQRVNFLQKGKYALTYQNLAIVASLWILLCVGAHGLFVVHGVWVKTKVMGVKAAEKAMNEEFERIVQLAQVSKSQERTGTALQSLASVFEYLPRWSLALNQLAGVVPGQVWLTLVKSATPSAGARVRRIEVEGRGGSAESITQLMQKLDETPLFQNVVLSRSAKDPQLKDLTFTIMAELAFPPVE